MLPTLESRNLQLNFELDFELSLNSVLKNTELKLIITRVNLSEQW